MSRTLSLIALATLVWAHVAAAQPADDPPGKPSAPAAFKLPAGYEGPPPPVAPASVSRNEAGRMTVRAVRLMAPLRIDGALDEALYREVEPASDFIQIEPHDAQPAINQTQVWLAFDDDNVYFAVNCFDNDMAHLVTSEMRRDNNTIFMGNDFVAFLFDTFYDRRNALFLSFNPAGARLEGQLTNERVYSPDWNPVWSVKTRRRADGWSAEAAVPFKSIRYQPGRSQIWGFQVQRMKRSTNELSFLAHPPKARLLQAYQHVSMFPTLVGIEAPPQSVNVDVKPYVVSSLATDVNASPRISNDPGGDFGLDAKLGITQNLIADVTYNTDFAQIEADEQQVNLTRFGLFFPEKRDFFLENQGTFNFGGISGGGFGGPAGGNDAPVLFYSRRIGLNGSLLVPIDGGGRLTGRIGKFEIGALDMRTGKEEASGARATNFSVVRVKRDILRKSSVGALFTGRSVAQSGVGSNQAYGLDVSLAFFQNLNIDTYWARTETDGVSSGDRSYRAQLNYTGDRYGSQIEHLDVGERFNPEVGFVRRADLRKDRAQFRFSPRPRSSKRIRKYTYQPTAEFFRNHRGVTESRRLEGEFFLDFQNADRIRVDFVNTAEFLPAPFQIAPGVTLPVGDYDYNNLHVGYQLGQQRRFSGVMFVERGTFYNGRKTTHLVRGRLNLSSQLSIEPTWSLNRVSLLQGSFTTNLIGSRATFTVTPLMFVNAFVQYNSSSRLASANIRFRWEWRPGSELFVVYNEERDAAAARFPALANRAFIVKVNRLFRF